MKKRKSKIIVMILTLVVLIVVGSIILNKVYNTKYEKLDAVDKGMFMQLSKINKEFSQNGDKLWSKEYELNKMPFILIRTYKDKGILRKYAYAINIKEFQDNIFLQKITIPMDFDLPEVYRLSNFSFDMISTLMPSNFGTVNINGKDIFYFKYHPKMIEDPDIYFDFSSFLLHESFHTYKQKDWTYDRVGKGEYIENYPTNKENYALMGLEFSLLDKCMEPNNKEDIKKYLKQWIIVRTYRYSKWPQLIGETNTEAIEGTARYIEYKYSKLTGGTLTVLAKKEKPYHVKFMEAYNYIANNQAESPIFLERPMKYETGAALGLLMDELNIDWKKSIEDSPGKNGKTQYEILKEYFNISDKDTSQDDMKEIEAENNYEELLKMGDKISELANKKR